MGKLAAVALMMGSFSLGYVAVGALDPNDPTNPRRGEVEYGDRTDWIWVNPAHTWRKELYYPEVKHNGPKERHVYRDNGRTRVVQRFNEDKQIWEDNRIDWIQPPARPMDYGYLSLDHVPDDGQQGNGQGAGGLDGEKWHE